MKTLTKSVMSAIMLGSMGAAHAEISGNVALASDYMFRGVSQTDNQIALQGGFDWSHDSGFYLGTWASNVDSNFFSGTSTDPQLELDLYGGFAGEMGDIGYDLGIIRYNYPGYDDANTTELYVTGSYSFLSAGLYYSNELNFIGIDESAWYFNLGAEYEVAPGFMVHASAGLNSGDAYDQLGAGTGADSYWDYSIGAGTSLAGVDLDLSYVDTDDDAETLFGDSVTDGRVVFTVSKSF